MKKTLPSLLTLVVASVVAIATPLSTLAQEVTPTQDVRNVSTESFRGEVVRVEPNTIFIRSGNETKEFTIPTTAAVKRNTFEATVSEIQPGDDATIVYTAEGQVLSLEVTSGEVTDWAKLLIPALTVGLLALFLIWIVRNRSNKSHIKTTKV